MPMSFELLNDSDIWTCDTGASSIQKNNKWGKMNERPLGSVSLGCNRETVKATCTVDLPGQFVATDGSFGMTSVLGEFNLLSLTRVLCNGCKISHGQSTNIRIKNDSEDAIDFYIVIPMVS
jgi:hypothetical protein